jgi:hypothetical protein
MILLGGAVCIFCASVQAGVVFIGDAIIDGNGTDKSGLPATILEDGKSPQNGLNGFGSGLTYAGNGVFYALADRGPNKVAYAGGAAVDNTTSYANRYQQFQISLKPVGSPLPGGNYKSYSVQATNIGTTLLHNAQGVQYQGLSTGFSTNLAIANTRLDSEGIAVAPGHTVWVSDEYGPYILQFNLKGQQIGSLALPPGFQIDHPGPTATSELVNTTGRTTNRGLEGLAVTPDGKTLVAMMQSSLIQDGGLNGKNTRLLVYDLTHPAAAPKQYVYQLDSKATPISELVAINNHQFLVDERDGVGGPNGIKKLYEIDLNQQNAPTNLANSAYSGTTANNGLPAGALPLGITVLQKTLFADIGQILNSAVPSPFSNVDGLSGLPDKIEGYAWGPDLPDGRHLLLATNDNDFASSKIVGYPNYIFAFAVDPSDVPGFQRPQFVPESGSLTIAGLSFLGFLIVRKRKRISTAIRSKV